MRIACRWQSSLVIVSLVVVWTSPSSAQLLSGPVPAGGVVGWVGLYNEPILTWLENENQLATLCGPEAKGNERWQQCRDEKMRPQVHIVPLFHGPRWTAPPAGSVTLVAFPGRGIQAYFTPRRGGLGQPFQPDLFDVDWGYGPYFHVTFLDRRGTWFLLPEQPFAPGTWLNTASLGPEPNVELLERDRVMTTPRGDLVFTRIGREFVRARPAQDEGPDSPCSSDKPLAPFTELRIPLRELYSATGHLLIHIKYTRGC